MTESSSVCMYSLAGNELSSAPGGRGERDLSTVYRYSTCITHFSPAET